MGGRRVDPEQRVAQILDWLRTQEKAQHALAIAMACGLGSDTNALRWLRKMEQQGLLRSARIGLGGRTYFHVPGQWDDVPSGAAT